MTRISLIRTLCALAVVLGQTGSATGNDGPIAHVLCASSQDMRHRLETRYRALLAWAGLRGPDQVMELWQDAEGDWTLVISYAGGKRCIVAMGDAFDPFAEMPHS